MALGDDELVLVVPFHPAEDVGKVPVLKLDEVNSPVALRRDGLALDVPFHFVDEVGNVPE